MTSSIHLRGVYVPLVTPFNASDHVDFDCLESLTRQAIDAGAAGVVALATTGEPTSLDQRERRTVVQVCHRVCVERGAELIVGAGTNDTRETIASHEALAEFPGVTASLAVVPYYVRPTEEGVLSHFQAVAARSPVPLVVYNIPYRTGMVLGARALTALAETPNVAGVKQAVGGIDLNTLELLATPHDGWAVLVGDDPYLFPLLLMGATGAIAASANVCTREFVNMVNDGLMGEVNSGRERAQILLPLVKSLFAEPNPSIIKALMHYEGRLPTPAVRMPLAEASPSGRDDAVAAHQLVMKQVESHAMLRLV